MGDRMGRQGIWFGVDGEKRMNEYDKRRGELRWMGAIGW